MVLVDVFSRHVHHRICLIRNLGFTELCVHFEWFRHPLSRYDTGHGKFKHISASHDLKFRIYGVTHSYLYGRTVGSSVETFLPCLRGHFRVRGQFAEQPRRVDGLNSWKASERSALVAGSGLTNRVLVHLRFSSSLPRRYLALPDGS